jgi:DNA-binding XRE family transcriptional regulator
LLQRRLIERQKELKYRDRQMAELLDIPRTSYNSIRHGRYKITMDVARKIVRAFPDLARYVFVEDAPEGE